MFTACAIRILIAFYFPYSTYNIPKAKFLPETTGGHSTSNFRPICIGRTKPNHL